MLCPACSQAYLVKRGISSLMFTIVTWSAVEASRSPLSLTPTRRLKLPGENSKGEKQALLTPLQRGVGKATVEGLKQADSFPAVCFLCKKSNVASSPLPFLSLEGFFFFSWLLPPWTNVHSGQPSLCLYNVPAIGPRLSQGLWPLSISLASLQMLSSYTRCLCCPKHYSSSPGPQYWEYTPLFHVCLAKVFRLLRLNP